MNKKLLHKTTRSFLILAVIILLISAPLFYMASHFLYIYEADEVLVFHKEAFLKESKKDFTEKDIDIWNKYNRNVNIVADKGLKKDSIFSTDYYDSTSNEYEPLRVLWAPIEINGKKYTYTEQSNLVVMEGMIVSIAVMFLLVIAFLMIGIIWLSKRSAEKLWAPFYNTLNQVRNFEIDKNNQPKFIPTDIAEFDTLNKSIDKLIEKNTAIYKNQREFIENAAHELQTPLALFQNKIDSLIQLDDITEQQSVLLDSLNSDISRLNRLNKNLLLLSKIENNEESLETQTVVINDYIKKNLDFFAEQAKPKNLTILTEFEEILKIETNLGLSEVLINNLFLNAIRHNEENGKIIITISNRSITFQNTGNNNPLISEKLFNRFAKLNPSGKGNGLGLAIVKKITERNHWEISYSYNDHLHGFTVKF